MNFVFMNLGWPGLVSKKTHKIHLALPPLDLVLMSNITTALGHKCQIIDGFVDGDSLSNKLIAEADWIIIATTPYHMWQCPNSDWEWIKKSIEAFPKKKVILTGLHASVFPEQTLRETGVHAVISREPEHVLSSYFERLDWKQTPGVSYLEGNNFQSIKYSALPRMDDLVVRDYCLDISKYSYFLLGTHTGVFEASRGCPWKCTFCDQEMFSWKYRRKSPAVFASEVSHAVAQTGMKTAYFYDLEFTVSKMRTLEICEALMKLNIHKKIRWCCQTRADTVDEDVLRALKAAGCTLIHYGVESANPEVLEATNKKITLDQISHGVKLTKDFRIQTACFFMFGLPGESSDRFTNTLEFARKLNPTYASFHFAIPFPGTPLYQEYLKKNNLIEGVWPSTYFQEWDKLRISKFLRSAYTKFYLFPRKFELSELRWRCSNLVPKIRYFMAV